MACCYRIWDRLNESTRSLLLLAERYCNGTGVSKSELKSQRRLLPERELTSGSVERYFLRAVRAAAFVHLTEPHGSYPLLQAQEAAHSVALALLPDEFRYRNAVDYWPRAEWRDERASQTALVRDIFGNPFRPVAFAPAWRTDTVKSLAAQMYESRDFSAMPILADALQDAGCDSTDILAHCRSNGPHVRGCWVVDLVLGRE